MYIILPSNKILFPLMFIMTVFSYYSIFYYLTPAYKVIGLGIQDIAPTRNLISVGYNPLLNKSIYSTLASLSANFYVIQFLFFFILLIRSGLSAKTILVFFSTLSYPLLVFSYIGRDGFVFWIFTFLSFFLFFKKYLPHALTRKISKLSLLIIPVFIIFFMIITIGRFSNENNSSENGIVYSLITYTGQGPINFAELNGLNFEPTHGKTCFSFFIDNGNKTEDLGILKSQAFINDFGVFSWTFKTFIGSFMFDFGRFGVLIFGLLTAIVIKFLSKHTRKGNISLSSLLIYFFYFNIIIQGVFYFRQYTRGGNIYILLIIVMYILFKFSERFYFKLQQNQIIINENSNNQQ